MKRPIATILSPLTCLLVIFFTTTSQAQNCDRACLEDMVDIYFDAVINDAPDQAPLADNVRFTENGQLLPLGEGLWKSMKSKGSYRLFVTDPDAGQVVLLTTVEEDHREPDQSIPAFVTLRLKVTDGKITEIEQMVERNEDTAKRIEAMKQPRPGLLATVPKEKRMSRKDMIEVSNKYFTGMQRNDGKGDYPFAEDCDRIENGGRSTNAPTPEGETRPDPKTSVSYSGQWSCSEQFESGLLYFVSRIRDRRFVAVDQERGLVVAIAFFDHIAGSTRKFKNPQGKEIVAGPTQPWTWYISEVFKVEDHQLHEIEAMLIKPPYGMLSGWSSWEDGMSDRARDVTGYMPEG